MKRLALLFLFFTLPAFAALTSGTTAPTFTTQASLAGKEFTYSLANALKTGPVVVYFYPAAFTQGCNIQAHTFAENMDKFAAANATVIGVSTDKIATLNAFSADPQYCAGKLPVAADTDGKIARSYDLQISGGFPGLKDTRGVAIDHDFAERTTFVITPDGKIAATVGGMKPAENVMKSLEIVRKIAEGKAIN
ncbi:MAG: peroxiredoxin [Gallionellaceae bacterium]|nr:peroxiredoxin [Gallionellaceae bacterium]